MEMTTNEINGLIGLFVAFTVMFAIAGWMSYSFYYKYENKERKKHSG